MKLNYNNILIITVIFIIFIFYIIYDTYSPIETFTSEDDTQNKLSTLKLYVQKLLELNDNEKNIRKVYRNSIISFRSDSTDKKTSLKNKMLDPKGFYSFCLTLKKYYETQNNIIEELLEITETLKKVIDTDYFNNKNNIFKEKNIFNQNIIDEIDEIDTSNIDGYLQKLTLPFSYHFYIENKVFKLNNINSNIIDKFEHYDLMIKEKFTNIQELDTQYNFIHKIYQILNDQTDNNKLDNSYLNVYKEVQTYEKNIDKILKQILDMLNRKNMNIFDETESSSKFIESANNKNQILLKYCKKLKLLDKPKNTNLITKRFNKEYINKKNEHIKKLEEEMVKLQSELFENEANKNNAYKLRTDDQSRKQYNAILKGIDNIKNSNKLKLNIV